MPGRPPLTHTLLLSPRPLPAAAPQQVGELREAVLYLVRSTETALHTFKRSYAWREAAKVRGWPGLGWDGQQADE